MIEARLFSEIFEEFEKAETKAEKIAVLRKYWHPRLQEFLEYAFNPNIQFDVEPPKTWRPAIEPPGLNVTYLDLEIPKLYRFIKDHPHRPVELANDADKKTKLLRVVLESLHPSESELLLKLIKKNLGVKGLTVKLIQDAISGK
jgi:hypothetical protein